MRPSSPFLLDTTVLIDVARRREPATTWLDETLRRPEQVSVSAITIAEFFAGVPPAERRDWEEFFDALVQWDVTREIAILAGSLRYDLARRGRAFLIPDALIAATAVTYGAVLVTANIKDFTGMGVATMQIA